MTARVLYIVTDSGTGGAEKVLLDILKGMNRDRFAPCGVVVLKQRREMAERWAAQGVPVVALGMASRATPAVLWRLRKMIRVYRPDVVHALLFQAVQAARLVRAVDRSFRLVSSPHINYRFLPPWARRLDRSLRWLDSAALCESRSTQSYLVKSMGYPFEKTAVAENGVDRSEFKFDREKRLRFRAQWGVTGDELVVGSVGRLHRQKGFDVLLEACEQLREHGKKFRIVVVGEGPDRDALEAFAKKSDLPLVLTGRVAEPTGVYSAFDLFVQSSRWEGFSIALLEAMSVGLPIAATAVDGTLDVAQDGKNMILARPDDPLSLGVAIGVLLEKPALRHELGANARATAERHTVASMVSATESAYEAVLPRIP